MCECIRVEAAQLDTYKADTHAHTYESFIPGHVYTNKITTLTHGISHAGM